MDKAQKKAGVPNSLSRKEEKANKKNTNKKRRQDDRKVVSETEMLPTFKQYLTEAKNIDSLVRWLDKFIQVQGQRHPEPMFKDGNPRLSVEGNIANLDVSRDGDGKWPEDRDVMDHAFARKLAQAGYEVHPGRSKSEMSIVIESAAKRKFEQMADAEIECPNCGGTGAMWHMGDREHCDECWGAGKIKPSDMSPVLRKDWERRKRNKLGESAKLNPNYKSAASINAKNTECETCGKRTKKADTRMVKGKLSCPACAKEEK